VHAVAFLNHKGGVGKTTLLYNIGGALAREGKRVLFVHADAQANLTSAAVEPDEIEGLLESDRTIYGALRPIVDGAGDLEACEPVQIREAAWLLAGDIRLSEFEEIAPQGWTDALAGNARGFRVGRSRAPLWRPLRRRRT
jgi:chromosome partitioning protein